MPSRDRNYFKKWWSVHKDKYNSIDRQDFSDFPEIHAILNKNKYLRRKYRLATMYPCKKVIWRLNKLIKDLESTNMDEIDSKYWEQLKPLFNECLKLTETWRKESNIIKDRHIIKRTIRTKFIEELPPTPKEEDLFQLKY